MKEFEVNCYYRSKNHDNTWFYFKVLVVYPEVIMIEVVKDFDTYKLYSLSVGHHLCFNKYDGLLAHKTEKISDLKAITIAL